MTSIYTISNNLQYYKQYYICSYCYNYIDNNPLKKHLVKADKINLYLNNNYETCSDSYDYKLSHTKCITCNIICLAKVMILRRGIETLCSFYSHVRHHPQQASVLHVFIVGGYGFTLGGYIC